MPERCTVFVKVDEDAIRGATFGVLQRPLCADLHFSALMDPENENEDLSILGQTYLRQAVISIYIYHMLAGLRWANVVRIHSGDEPGADVEFASKAEAMVFKLSAGVR
ncbi:hypothetical protein ABID21_004599 [Pseudorhizobium tarimense]|uniref:Uncharacterized protein n=1 Tax=Pseudorhizobium tarimense TaxID=1079109 RepID=A0ABV2HD48_9HYPH|nr:hypothetical protein [Pseudorhizobium tarimense]MCJ8521463.1 hypothetical protein [Pseudorhizobium tarimense]